MHMLRHDSGKPLVSVIVPVFNEEENVMRTYGRIARVFDQLPDHDMELIFADNHSTDETEALLASLAEKDSRVRLLRWSRNVGYQRSLLMAYQKARGDCAVQIDADLQDPPEMIPQMLAAWSEGHAVIYGIRKKPAGRPCRRGPAADLLRDDRPAERG